MRIENCPARAPLSASSRLPGSAAKSGGPVATWSRSRRIWCVAQFTHKFTVLIPRHGERKIDSDQSRHIPQFSNIFNDVESTPSSTVRRGLQPGVQGMGLD